MNKRQGHIARNCPKPKVETRNCNRCGKKGHLASQHRVLAREVTEEEGEAVISGSCVIDEVQDVDVGKQYLEDDE